MSANQEPQPISHKAGSYEADPETWREIVSTADFIVDNYGTLREQNGMVDADWASDFHDKRFTLIRQPAEGDAFHYWLKFALDSSFSHEVKASYLEFRSDKPKIIGMHGPAAEVSSGLQADERLEQAEIELLSYLEAHPELLKWLPHIS